MKPKPSPRVIMANVPWPSRFHGNLLRISWTAMETSEFEDLCVLLSDPLHQRLRSLEWRPRGP
jgi:hypothetical protein